MELSYLTTSTFLHFLVSLFVQNFLFLIINRQIIQIQVLHKALTMIDLVDTHIVQIISHSSPSRRQLLLLRELMQALVLLLICEHAAQVLILLQTMFLNAHDFGSSWQQLVLILDV